MDDKPSDANDYANLSSELFYADLGNGKDLFIDSWQDGYGKQLFITVHLNSDLLWKSENLLAPEAQPANGG